MNKNAKCVILKRGYLVKVIEKAVKKVGNQKILTKKLGFKSNSIISKYKQEQRLPSMFTLKKLAKLAHIPSSTIKKKILEIKEPNWWRKESGRKGGSKTYSKYGSNFYKNIHKKLLEKYPHEYFQNLGLTTYKKYGNEHMKKMASKVGKLLPVLYPEEKKKWGRKGGMIGAERQKPTSQELNLIEENIENGITNFNLHKSIGNINSFKNFDFVYNSNGKIALIEEVTDITPVKPNIYSKILEICESKKFLENLGITVPIIFTCNLSKKSTNMINMPLDAIYVLLQEGILPVFYNLDSMERVTFIKGILSNYNNGIIQDHKTKIGSLLLNKINERIKESEKGSRGQLKIQMNTEENLLNEKLIEYGFKPKGKYMLNSRYGTIVVDNFIELGNSRILFEVKRVKGRRSFMKAALDLAAKFFIIKSLYDKQATYVSVIIPCRKLELNSESYQIKLLKKYSDIVIMDGNLDRLKSFLENLNVGK